MCQLLCRLGADIDALNNKGQTPLEVAGLKGHPATIHYVKNNNINLLLALSLSLIGSGWRKRV